MSVKLVKTYNDHTPRCAVVCGPNVWVSDRLGNIEVRKRSNRDEIIKSIPRESGNLVWCMLYINGYVWVGQEVGPVIVFKASTFQRSKVLTWHVGGVPCITADAGGAVVWTGSIDFLIVAWSAKGFRKLSAYSGHTNGVRCLLHIGNQLWSGADDHTIRVWDTTRPGVEGGRCLQVLEGHEGSVLSLVVAGKGVWSGSDDGTIREWGLAGGRQCLRKVSDADRISVLVPMGTNHVWACGREPSVTVWDMDTMQKLHRLEGHTSWVNMLCRVERCETRVLWSGSLSDKSMRVWEHKSYGEVPSTADLQAANRVLAASSDDMAEQAAAAQRERLRAEALRGELEEAARAQLLELAAMAAGHAARAAALAGELEAARAEAAKLQGDLASARADGASKAAEISRLLGEMESLRAAEAGLRKERDGLQALLGEARRALEACTLERDAAREEARRLQEQLATGAAGAGELAAKLRAALDEAARLKTELIKEQERSRALLAAKGESDVAAAALRAELDRLQRERDEAMEREALMRSKYKELDIFKLDIIAREMKKVDAELKLVQGAAKGFGTEAKRFGDFEAKERSTQHAHAVSDELGAARAHVRDIITQCLTELQKMHIGVAIDDPLAAGELEDGGVMAGMAVDTGGGVDTPHITSESHRAVQESALMREGARRSRTPTPPRDR